jgi:hypothetical protein
VATLTPVPPGRRARRGARRRPPPGRRGGSRAGEHGSLERGRQGAHGATAGGEVLEDTTDVAGRCLGRPPGEVVPREQVLESGPRPDDRPSGVGIGTQLADQVVEPGDDASASVVRHRLLVRAGILLGVGVGSPPAWRTRRARTTPPRAMAATAARRTGPDGSPSSPAAASRSTAPSAGASPSTGSSPAPDSVLRTAHSAASRTTVASSLRSGMAPRPAAPHR